MATHEGDPPEEAVEDAGVDVGLDVRIHAVVEDEVLPVVPAVQRAELGGELEAQNLCSPREVST
jgi:hypothetical protein